MQEVHAAAQAVNTSSVEISTLEMPIEAAEFYVQLYGAFNQLSNPKICYIYDGDSTSSDPYTGFFINRTPLAPALPVIFRTIED